MAINNEKKKEIDETFNNFFEDAIIKYGLKKSSGQPINPLTLSGRLSIAKLISSDMAEVEIAGADIEGEIFDYVSSKKSEIIQSVINDYTSE